MNRYSCAGCGCGDAVESASSCTNGCGCDETSNNGCGCGENSCGCTSDNNCACALAQCSSCLQPDNSNRRRCYRTLITSPSSRCCVDALTEITGYARPGTSVVVTVDCNTALSAEADECGFWSVANPYPLTAGQHKVCAMACGGRSTCVCFRVCGSGTVVPVPTIDYPADGSFVAEPQPVITGTGTPGNYVHVCLTSDNCLTTVVNSAGMYALQFPTMLVPGKYTITATQETPAGAKSATVESVFYHGYVAANAGQ